MGRSDGAKVWARVLSELADVPVTVEWERPAWRVRWCDGPTRGVLMERAAALAGYRVGAPLGFEQLRFVRSSSAVSVALGWLARGSPAAGADPTEVASLVETWCEDTGYPESRFDEQVLAAADLLCRVGRGDTAEMGNLIARAVPPVPPQVFTDKGPELTGRVDQSAVAGRRPTRGTPRTLRCTSSGTVGNGGRCRSLRVVRRRHPRGRFGSRSAGQVLQRSVPGGRPPRTPSRARGHYGRSVSRRPMDRTPRAPTASALNHVDAKPGLRTTAEGISGSRSRPARPVPACPTLPRRCCPGKRQATVEIADWVRSTVLGRRHPAARHPVPVPTRRR